MLGIPHSHKDGDVLSKTFIAQNYIYCEQDASFSFSPLGRLTAFNIAFWSEDLPLPIMKALEEKHKNISWEYECSQPINVSCNTGTMKYAETKQDTASLINITLSYHNILETKKFEKGKFLYQYEIGFDSQYINAIDTIALRKTLIKTTPKAATRM
jgi:hypothetical protein